MHGILEGSTLRVKLDVSCGVKYPRGNCVSDRIQWGKDRSGKPNVKRRTSRKKLRGSLKNFTQWCKENRHQRLDVLFKKMNAKLRGYYAYYGVIGNYASLQEFFREAVRILFKWLNRCSQRRSYNWKGFQELLELFKIEKPRIVGRPKARKAALTF